MANARGTPRYGVIRPMARTPVVEEIVPNSGWTEDSTGHYLLVDLPEFVKEDVKLQVDSSGRIVVKGERQASEQKRVNFHLSFPAPEDAEVDKIAGKFDGGILYVTLPKRIVQEKNKQSDTEETGISSVERAEEHDSHKTSADSDVEGRDHNQHAGHEVHEEERNIGHEEHEEERNENAHMTNFSGQVTRKWDQETMLRTAVDVLSKNKGIVVTAVIAFSLG
ncbi:hypothetical protein TSUD_208870, partial [Trifolium subterraneum]